MNILLLYMASYRCGITSVTAVIPTEGQFAYKKQIVSTQFAYTGDELTPK